MNPTIEKAKALFLKSYDIAKQAIIGGIGVFKKSWFILSLCTALAGAAAYILWLNHKNEQAATQIEEVNNKVEELKQQNSEIVEINKKNEEVYKKLSEDRARMEQMVEMVNYNMKMNVKALNTISNKVSKLEDGPLAPVLRETVRDIQKLREKRDEKN